VSGLPPLIVQSDGSILLEVDNPLYEEARDSLARFASLEKSPEHFHTYRITPLSLWNAAAAGMPAEAMIDSLIRHGRYDLPDNVRLDIFEYVSRYGRLSLVREKDDLLLICHDPSLMAQVTRQPELAPLIKEQRDQSTLVADPAQRGRLKWALVRLGYPAEDLAGYVEGAPLALRLLRVTRSGQPFRLRHYQEDAVAHFHAGGAAHGGSGVITLPCGAGKTVVGMGVMEKVQAATLILTPSTVSARQWIDELLDKTSLLPEDIGEYSGQLKQLRPVTVTTYQILTYRPRRSQDFPHFDLFNREDWGLIIYDEVHLLPAPIFRVTADIQARRTRTARMDRRRGLLGDPHTPPRRGEAGLCRRSHEGPVPHRSRKPRQVARPGAPPGVASGGQHPDHRSISRSTTPYLQAVESAPDHRQELCDRAASAFRGSPP